MAPEYTHQHPGLNHPPVSSDMTRRHIVCSAAVRSTMREIHLGRLLFRKLSPRSRWLQTVGQHAEGSFLYLFWVISRYLSPEHASACGHRLIRWLGPKTHKHRQIKRNLQLAFPELSNGQRESLALDIWGNFGAVMAEYPHLDTITAGGSPPFVDRVMDRAAREILENKQPAIYVTAHIGNWELVGSTITHLGVPFSVLYSPQPNPVLERMIQQQRNLPGYHFIAKTNGIRQLVRDMRAGHSIGMLSDQRVDSGKPVPFFGHTAQTTTSPASLALKLNCPLIPVQIERTGNARFRAIFHRPLLNGSAADRQKNPVQITAELNRLFEQWIRHQPGQWACIKRRWKTATP